MFYAPGRPTTLIADRIYADHEEFDDSQYYFLESPN